MMTFFLTTNGFNETFTEILKNVPSFRIQTLLDKLPGNKISNADFVSNTIESKYYTPIEFMNQKISKKHFTMMHLNIASLSRHIDELRSLLTLLNNPFDIIAITETRLHEPTPLVDLNIDGFDFHHKETSTQCGGAAIYVKSTYEYEVLNKLSAVHHNICESIFI